MQDLVTRYKDFCIPMHSHHALSFDDLASNDNSEISMLLPVLSSHGNAFLRKLIIAKIKSEVHKTSSLSILHI